MLVTLSGPSGPRSPIVAKGPPVALYLQVSGVAGGFSWGWWGWGSRVGQGGV